MGGRISPNAMPEIVTAGNMLMVGAGSVGSSAVYCMRLVGIAGTMSIVDRDAVKVENFNRSPIFARLDLRSEQSGCCNNIFEGLVTGGYANPGMVG